MGDAGEGLIDADARIQRAHGRTLSASVRRRGRRSAGNPEQVRALESLRLARTELEGQLEARRTNVSRAQITAGDRRSRPAV